MLTCLLTCLLTYAWVLWFSPPFPFSSGLLLSFPFLFAPLRFSSISFQVNSNLRFSDANQFCTSHIRVSSFQIHSFPCPFYSLTIRSDSYRVISFPMLRKRSRSYPIRIKSIPCRFVSPPIQSFPFPFVSAPQQFRSIPSLAFLDGSARRQRDEDPCISQAVRCCSTRFHFQSNHRPAIPIPSASQTIISVSSRSFRFLVFSVHLHVCTVRCFSITSHSVTLQCSANLFISDSSPCLSELVHSYSVRSSPFLFGFAVVYYFLLPKTPCLCTSLRILSPLIYPAESAADSSLIFFMISSRSDR